MELFKLQTAPGLLLGEKVSPIRFKALLPEGAVEQDLEDLIVARPDLLNQSDKTSPESPDLKIISRQPHTQTGKRADLFAISQDAELVIIELKRDALERKKTAMYELGRRIECGDSPAREAREKN